ncbi:MAG: spore coat U domain-containing protein, partial [Hyphomicrobium sp.]|nr:spore coat U domain-containing protein [Hyphomicrobium sp.]
GGGSGATVTTRKMTGPEDATIDYTLYQSSEHSTVWGDESVVNRKTATGSGIAQTHTIYGRVPVQTTPATGTYSDTVTIIVHY